MPGKPEKSLLVSVVRATKGELQMPPKGEKLLQGANHRTGNLGSRRGRLSRTARRPWRRVDPASPEAKQFWSFGPLRKLSLRLFKTRSGRSAPIDTRSCCPRWNSGSSRRPPRRTAVSIRRAAFDLLGLPPTPEEVDASFVTRYRVARARSFARSPPRLAALRRTLGTLLARLRPLRRRATRTSLEVREAGVGSIAIGSCGRSTTICRTTSSCRRQLAADQLAGVPTQRARRARFPGRQPGVLEGAQARADDDQAIVADEWEERIDALGARFSGSRSPARGATITSSIRSAPKDYYALAGVFASTRLVDLHSFPTRKPQRCGRRKQISGSRRADQAAEGEEAGPRRCEGAARRAHRAHQET